MEYERKKPVTKESREARRRQERSQQRRKEEANRRRSIGGGKSDELGVAQGQNGEQGNSIDPTLSKDIGRKSH